MTRLGLRLATGARESVVRLVVTAAGVALAATLLCYAPVAFSALHAHEARRGWTDTSPHNRRPGQDEATTDPLLWRLSVDHFRGRAIVRVDVAAEGPHSPLLAGLARFPGPGELAVSRSFGRLLRAAPADELADRFPGRITQTVGDAALEAPDQLVVFVGHAADELRAEPGVHEVHSVETAPARQAVERFLQVVLVIGGVGLLVPVVVFVATAARLAAARRDQRLAALRLAGATPRQVRGFAALEAVVAALAGEIVGLVLFLATRPIAARIPFDGSSFFASDLHLPAAWAVLILVGVPILAVAAASLALRRVNISPLGVTRGAAPVAPTARRLGVLAAGLALFVPAVVWTMRSNSGGAALLGIGASFALIVLGMVIAGPWITRVVARAASRMARRPTTLLAARRLERDPTGAFRAIAGLTLAVFLATVFNAVAATVLFGNRVGSSAFPPTSVAATAVIAGRDFGTAPPMPPAAANALIRLLRADGGVRHVAAVREVPPGRQLTQTPLRDADVNHGPRGVVSCSDASSLGLPSCAGTTAIWFGSHGGVFDPTRVAIDQPVALDQLDDLPLAAVVVGTDGAAASVERLRTEISRAMPGVEVDTGADVTAENTHQLRAIERLSNTGLALVLLIAGCSLAVSVAGSLVERKRPFALLRLTGVRIRDLHRVVIAEAAAPLLVISVTSAALGLGVAASLIALVNSGMTFQLPSAGYWAGLLGGLSAALAAAASTLPLLDRLTALETARFE